MLFIGLLDKPVIEKSFLDINQATVKGKQKKASMKTKKIVHSSSNACSMKKLWQRYDLHTEL